MFNDTIEQVSLLLLLLSFLFLFFFQKMILSFVLAMIIVCSMNPAAQVAIPSC